MSYTYKKKYLKYKLKYLNAKNLYNKTPVKGKTAIIYKGGQLLQEQAQEQEQNRNINEINEQESKQQYDKEQQDRSITEIREQESKQQDDKRQLDVYRDPDLSPYYWETEEERRIRETIADIKEFDDVQYKNQLKVVLMSSGFIFTITIFIMLGKNIINY